jgi:Phage tail assembly chaperone protein
MSRTWSFYSLETGRLSRCRVVLPSHVAPEAYAPDGHAAIEGALDWDLVGVQIPVNQERPVLIPVDALPMSPGALASQARARRDRLLSATSWIVERALELGNPVPEAWVAYRQALRDVPQQPGFPEVVVWPEPPAP